MSGQINLGTPFGNAILEIARNPRYSSFCEVGAWNGCGTTKCIFEGIRNREGTVMYSIECDKNMFAQAYEIWKNIPKVHLLYGTLHRNIMTRDQVESHPAFHLVKDHYNLWYSTDLYTIQNSPLISVPNCDVILLDGGEFSTQGDWDILYNSNLKVIILDDTFVIKTSNIRAQLLNDTDWKCVYDTPSDRNGCSIFERIN